MRTYLCEVVLNICANKYLNIPAYSIHKYYRIDIACESAMNALLRLQTIGKSGSLDSMSSEYLKVTSNSIYLIINTLRRIGIPAILNGLMSRAHELCVD